MTPPKREPRRLSHGLPIEEVRGDVLDALQRLGRVVISAPTGSGKSTCVPIWLAERGPSRVLVVEPRRVACSALAKRVGEMVQTAWGEGTVGYVVRHANTMTDRSRVVFATPGVVLRWQANPDSSPQFDVMVLDEFHERTLQTDLIAAIALERELKPLVVMSATVAGDRVASYIDGEHVRGEGRMHPVEVTYDAPSKVLLPDGRDLAQRIARTVDALFRDAPDGGDVLVFVPGKGEIRDALEAIGRVRPEAVTMGLHGGLSLRDQSKVFAPSKRRKVIVATNVAETSLTVPGIGVVIDSGLVRRTRYHGGRGVLTLVPVAMDSATQRSGRAGRTRAGRCIRLWSPQARLSEMTPPEIARDSLVPLVLAASNAGSDVRHLPFLDPPAPHAIEAAIDELDALGAVASHSPGAPLTDTGAALFRLPIEPALGRLLSEASRKPAPTPTDALDLVAALSVRGSMFRRGFEDEDLRDCKDDALALIRAVRADRRRHPEIVAKAHSEALERRSELARLLTLSPPPATHDRPVDRDALAAVVMRALPTSVFVQRKRQSRGAAAWGGPGVEVTLGRDSSVDPEKTRAIAALTLHAAGGGQGKPSLKVSAAMPLRFRELAAAAIGHESVTHVTKVKRRIVATIQRTYGGRVLAEREEAPKGALAREALARMMLDRRLFRAAMDTAEAGLRRWALARRLVRLRRIETFEGATDETPSLEQHVAQTLELLGVESGNDLQLLGPEDFAIEPLPDSVTARLERDFPLQVTIGGSRYRCVYELANNTAVLELIKGDAKKPPPVALLPRFAGMKVAWVARGKRRALRG